MTQPILITGAGGRDQGSTGRIIATTLLEQGIPVRAFVHRLDERSNELRRLGADILEGDLLQANAAFFGSDAVTSRPI